MPSSATKKRALLFGGIGLVLAAIGVVVSFILMNQSQDVRQKAATSTGTGVVSIDPTTETLDPGDTTTATVSFSTEGATINGLTVRLSFPYTGTLPLKLADLEIDPAISGPGGLTCNVTSITDTSSPVILDVGCTTSTGYTNTELTDLFTFSLTAGENGTTAPVQISFESAHTVMTVSAEDIAAIPSTSLTVTLPQPEEEVGEKTMDITFLASCDPNELEVTASLADANDDPMVGNKVRFTFNNQNKEQNSDTDGEAGAVFSYATAGSYTLKVNSDGFNEVTETIEIDACPAVEATPTPTPAPTLISCNGACSSSTSCAAGLTCYSGRCRSVSCQSDTTCRCQTTNVASTSGATSLPQTGSFDRTLALILIGGLLTVGGVQMLLGRSLATVQSTQRESIEQTDDTSQEM